MLQIDTKRIVSEVAAQHKIVIDEHDPMITFATINGIIMQLAMEEAAKDISRRLASFTASIDTLERRTGEALGKHTALLMNEATRQIRDAITTAPHAGENKPRFSAWLVITGVSAAAFLLGVLLGRIV